jgi:hypothetical protein
MMKITQTLFKMRKGQVQGVNTRVQLGLQYLTACLKFLETPQF